MKRTLIAACLAVLPVMVFAQKAEPAQSAKAQFIDAQGKDVGAAELEQTPGGVLIKLDLKGLPPGEHAFHVHEKGACEQADGFKSAGGHFAGGGGKHGHVKGGPHAGDMPNQFVAQDGSLRAHVMNPKISLGSGKGNVFDKDGSALVLHAKPDDYKSQPAGDAGDRIACAVIKK